MRTSLKWIKALVPGLDVTPQEFADAMTLAGNKVEYYTDLAADLDKIVVGRILSIRPHEDSDHLLVCQVDVGTKTIQIVTGAPNVREGQLVPVALDGGRVAGGHDGSKTEGGIRIKAGKLRGVSSEGMMCSIEELGSSRDMYPEAPEYGIYVFEEDADLMPGDDVVRALGLDDVVVEYEITSNRVDCFSVLGLAREAAATFGRDFCPDPVTETGNREDVRDYVSVEVKNHDLCARYTARLVKNVRIAPSPKWMQRRLMAQGIRPINNIVDITNYVMEEYGQPMHAYDLDRIAGQRIGVRNAAEGEKFTSLDGQEHTLDASMLMICDKDKPIGLAGIMGGENSMITDDVHTMLFEAATFDGTNIRLSSRRAGLRTDASAKFEKGLDPNLAIEGMNRACQLIEELGAGEVVGGVIDIYPERVNPWTLPFQADAYNHLLGTQISPEQMIEYLKPLGIGYDREKEQLQIPTYRQDLHCDADIAEEIARFYGYANIPTSLPGGSYAGGLSRKQRIEGLIRDTAEFCGFSQAMCYSFESPRVFDKLLLPAEDPLRKAIRISNPLGEDFSIMRTCSLNGILTSLGTNYSRRNADVWLYEMGNVYLAKSLPLTELPEERLKLTLGGYGAIDFYQMKGAVEEILAKLDMRDRVSYDPGSGYPFLHPGRQANIRYEGQEIGYIGQMHPSAAGNYGIKDPVYVAVLDVGELVCHANFAVKYEGIANFPASRRDLSMVVPREILAGDIEDIFASCGGRILESYELFDIYEGAQILSGYKSMAYTLTFRAKDRNLSDEDVNRSMDSILKALKEKGIRLRE